jgi:amino acid transporter
LAYAQAQVIISIGAFAALTSSILGGLLYLPRIYFTMARDGKYLETTPRTAPHRTAPHTPHTPHTRTHADMIARAGLMWPIFSYIHPKTHTPLPASIVTGTQHSTTEAKRNKKRNEN